MKNLFLRNPVRALTLLAILLVLPFAGMMSHAQTDSAPLSVNSSGATGELIGTIFKTIFWLLIVVAIILFVVAAFSFINAWGDPEKVKKGYSRILYAVIAVVLALLARAVPIMMCSFSGGDCSSA